MSSRGMIKSQIVELYVPTGNDTQTKFIFQDQPQLRWAKLWNIEVYTGTDVTKTPTQHDVYATSVLQTGYLTLYCQDKDASLVSPTAGNPNPAVKMGENINQLPLLDLHIIQNGTDPFVRNAINFGGMLIDWSKTYVILGQAVGSSNKSFLFSVSYSLGPIPLGV